MGLGLAFNKSRTYTFYFLHKANTIHFDHKSNSITNFLGGEAAQESIEKIKFTRNTEDILRI